MLAEVKNGSQLRVGLIREILSEAIFIRIDQPLWEFFHWTTVLLPCRDRDFGATPDTSSAERRSQVPRACLDTAVRISMNMYSSVCANGFALSMMFASRGGKVAKHEKSLCEEARSVR
jgi:hypothetical protein